jgi:hypothetical protein
MKKQYMIVKYTTGRTEWLSLGNEWISRDSFALTFQTLELARAWLSKHYAECFGCRIVLGKREFLPSKDKMYKSRELSAIIHPSRDELFVRMAHLIERESHSHQFIPDRHDYHMNRRELERLLEKVRKDV